MKRKIIKVNSIIIKSMPTTNDIKTLGFIFLSLLAFTLFIFGCGSFLSNKIEINEIGIYPQSLIKLLPIKVGVYYGNDFGTFETFEAVERQGENSLIYFEDIKMGKANIALFDYIFSHVFKEVTLIQHFPEKFDNITNIDIIIEPKIKDYSSYIIQGFTENEYHVDIEYVIKFYSPTSEPIGSWTIKGKGFVSYSMSLPQTLAKKATKVAMRKVAAKFMTDLCNQVDRKKLFYKECCQ